jgi:hypothetical protein
MRQLRQINYGDTLASKFNGNRGSVHTIRHNIGIENITQSQTSP